MGESLNRTPEIVPISHSNDYGLPPVEEMIEDAGYVTKGCVGPKILRPRSNFAEFRFIGNYENAPEGGRWRQRCNGELYENGVKSICLCSAKLWKYIKTSNKLLSLGKESEDMTFVRGIPNAHEPSAEVNDNIVCTYLLDLGFLPFPRKELIELARKGEL